MKTKLLLAAGLAAVSMAGGTIHKANAVTDTGLLTAEIIAPVALECGTTTLDFGQIITSASAGTVAVDTDGTVTDSPGATYVVASGAAAAQCDLSGDTGQVADVSIQGSPSVSGPGAPMTVTNFVFDYNGGASTGGPVLNDIALSATAAPLLIGATLNVGANQVAGVYNGTFTVEVVYD